ncbi:MAG: F0F1 ATP synthase subunit B [Nitrospirae bacterium]|nr:F0F1 ATP synthase subunit B [Nitrospirota bacterium]
MSSIIKVICGLILICLVPVIAFAVGAEAEGQSHIMEWVWKVVNFAILVFILVKFLGKPLKGFLKQRTELIQKTLDEARQARELAEKALREVEERLKGKDKEIEGIISSSRQSGEKEQEFLVSEGERLSKKIIEQAKVNIDFELKKAKEAIKAEAVELAMELAEKKLKEKLTPEEQRKLLEESLSKLEVRA